MTAAPPRLRPTPADLSQPDLFFFETDRGSHMLAVDGSRVFDVPAGLAEEAQGWDRAAQQAFIASLGVENAPPFIGNDVPQDLPIRSLSLAVAQKCNLACAYCYAAGGDFGAPARNMGWDTAQASIDQLLAGAAPGDRVSLAFMGGEPLINRPLIRRATAYLSEAARARGVRAGFSLTTNATLLTPEDCAFFAEHGFAVTVSIDGLGDTHDKLRSYRGGRGSFAQIVARLEPFLANPGRAQISARVTVTPENLDLAEALDGLIAMGFHSVGFAPMLSAPDDSHEMQPRHLARMLEAMIACGQRFEDAVRAGQPYPFSNMQAAMTEIHRGTHRPYPCGAGAGYLGVSADGDLYACHRFVEDPAGAMGNVTDGLDQARRAAWLDQRHVHRQSPCTECWARYLCGGGCHHETLSRGRPACDYIRGWLEYCLQAYMRLSEDAPDYFAPQARAAQ